MENTMQSQSGRSPRSENFIKHTINRCKDNKGLAARLRRADNLALQYQSWDYFAAFGINIEAEEELLPHAIVASAIAKTKKLQKGEDGQLEDGQLFLGRAIARCYPDEKQEDSGQGQGQMKLRRLLACRDITELFRVLRPLLALIDSRVQQPLNHTRLLNQLIWFNKQPDRIRAKWAMEFFRKPDNQPDQEHA